MDAALPPMDEDAAARATRRAARRNWPIRPFDPRDDAPADLSHVAPEDRLALAWTLTLAAWHLSGRPLPLEGVPRSQWPVRLGRL